MVEVEVEWMSLGLCYCSCAFLFGLPEIKILKSTILCKAIIINMFIVVMSLCSHCHKLNYRAPRKFKLRQVLTRTA